MILGVVIVLAVGGFLFYQKQMVTKVGDEKMTPALETATPESTTGAAMMESGTVKEFTVTSNGPNYDLKQIKVKKGDSVKITFVNNVGTHNLLIDEYNIKYNPIPAGTSKVIEFTADKAGTFKYYCSVANHRQLGQEGNLIVE